MKVPLFASVLLLTAACTRSTSNIGAAFEASLDKDANLTFNAYFYEDPDQVVPMILDHGDRVIVTFRGQVLDLGVGGGSTFYTATIVPVPPVAADEDVTFSVDRDGGDDAPSSTIKTTAPIGLQQNPLFVSRSNDFTLSWTTRTDDEMEWAVYGCLRPKSGAIDPGATSLTIPKNTFQTTMDGIGTCSAELSLNRGRLAPVDPAFGWGEVLYAERLLFDIASTP